jgi:energy-coupling factor transport system permease protein
MVTVIIIRSYVCYFVVSAFLLLAVLVSKIPFKFILRSLRGLIVLIIFTSVLNLFFYSGDTLLASFWVFKIYKEGVILSITMVIRIILLIIGASLLTFTTTPIMLTDGIEKLLSPLSKIHFPSHEIAMMMSLALRFIPTFAEETERIIKAQTARGADFDSKGPIKKVKSFLPVLVPLFVSAFGRAEDLATAMEARCYRGGKGRTRLRILKFGRPDGVLFALMLIVFAAVILIQLCI